MGEEIIIDKELLRAIGADARISILKSLAQHQKTQSDLAKELKLSAPTILEHLNQLESAGLVERKEEGRKWKYYTLTRKGEKIVSSSNKKIGLNVIITLGIIAVFLAAALFYIPQLNTPHAQYDEQIKGIDQDESDGSVVTPTNLPDSESNKYPSGNYTNSTK